MVGPLASSANAAIGSESEPDTTDFPVTGHDRSGDVAQQDNGPGVVGQSAFLIAASLPLLKSP